MCVEQQKSKAGHSLEFLCFSNLLWWRWKVGHRPENFEKGGAHTKSHLFVEWKTAATNLRVSTGLHHASSINSLQGNDWTWRDGVTTAYVQCAECTKSRQFDICLRTSRWSIRPCKSRRKKTHRSSHVPNGSSMWLRHTQFTTHHAITLQGPNDFWFLLSAFSFAWVHASLPSRDRFLLFRVLWIKSESLNHCQKITSYLTISYAQWTLSLTFASIQRRNPVVTAVIYTKTKVTTHFQKNFLPCFSHILLLPVPMTILAMKQGKRIKWMVTCNSLQLCRAWEGCWYQTLNLRPNITVAVLVAQQVIAVCNT